MRWENCVVGCARQWVCRMQLGAPNSAGYSLQYYTLKRHLGVAAELCVCGDSVLRRDALMADP